MTRFVGGLFDGCGLLAYGLHLAGWEHRWLCELDEFRQGILRQRFPGVPVYPDVRAVGADAARVDLIAGGFPCKGVSSAGKREGFGHPESALWREMHRIIGDLRPRYVLVENVADLLSLHRGEVFGEVVGSLAALGYDAEWDCFPAAAFGAPHLRDRVFITAIAHADRELRQAGSSGAREERAGRAIAQGAAQDAPDASGQGLQGLSGSVRGETAGIADTGGSAEAAPDPERAGRARSSQPDSARQAGGLELATASEPAGRGAPVCWGRYERAIERWEDIVGRAAPEPLVRRVDDGSTRRLERSRLSALGDGVLVQAGWLVGRRILEHEATLVTELVA